MRGRWGSGDDMECVAVPPFRQKKGERMGHGSFFVTGRRGFLLDGHGEFLVTGSRIVANILRYLGGIMPDGLKRLHRSGQSHFITFSCYHRLPLLAEM